MPHLVRNYDVLSYGAQGIVFKINERIALKHCRNDVESGSFEKENSFYDVLESHEPCPHILQSFLRTPVANFMALMPDSLHFRYFSENPNAVAVIPEPTARRWAAQLCAAAAWLETLTYAHNDIRTPNMLIDSGDNLKLSDFDSALPVGQPFPGAAPPWARLLGHDAKQEGVQGGFGKCGARTEQFSIGSIIYLLTRGREPFEDMGEDTIDKLRDMEFPRLEGGWADDIIDSCWRNRYKKISDLKMETGSILDAGKGHVQNLEAIDREEMRRECLALIEEGSLEQTG